MEWRVYYLYRFLFIFVFAFAHLVVTAFPQLNVKIGDRDREREMKLDVEGKEKQANLQKICLEKSIPFSLFMAVYCNGHIFGHPWETLEVLRDLTILYVFTKI